MIPNGSKLYKAMLLLVAIALICGVGVTQRSLNKSRATLGLTTSDPLENAPPVLAFTTVALGGFRGLIANVLWIRANDLQDEGKFFEMVQLADWITKMQPHFTTVWIHQAWNMAYNISIKFNDPHDRWLWVLRGVELLRDQGLKYNEKEPLLYRELAWFFQHKMGHYLDDAHYSYKQFWIEDMNQVLGNTGGRPNFDALINPRTEEEQAKAKLLREKFKMDPKLMQEIDQKYGPLEWRLPETSAIYWAMAGLRATGKEELKKEDMITLRRVIFQSMQLAFHRGRLIYPKKGETTFFYGPNLEIVKRTNDTYEEQMELEADKRDHIGTGHKNFLQTAVYFLYSHNRQAAAREWFNYLKQKYPKAIPPNVDVDQFALAKVTEDAGETDPHRIKSLLEGLWENSFMNLAIGEDDQAIAYDAMGKRIWDRYHSEIGRMSTNRVGLPQVPKIKAEVLERLLDPQSPLDPVIVSQLRTRLGRPAEPVTSTNRVEAVSPPTNAVTNPTNVPAKR